MVGKDLTIAGRLNVKNFTNQNIINTTTNNYQLIVSEDLSLNGRMYVKGNVMIGSGNEPSYLLDVSSASAAPFRVGVGATNAIFVNSTGKVAIGTNSNPEAPLFVCCNSAGLAPDNNGIYCYNPNNSAGNRAIIGVRTAGSSAGNPFFSMDVNGLSGWAIGIDNADSQKLKINAGWDSLSNDTKMTIDRNGKVGIGVTGPVYTLDVSSASAAPFRVGVGATNALVVNSTGNVGIGTTNPAYTLDVNGIINKTSTILIAEVRSNSSSLTYDVANSTISNLKFTSIAADGGFSGITNASSITIPYTGYYKIGLKFQGVAVGAVNSYLTTWVVKNGVNLYIPFQMGFPGISTFTQTLYGEQHFYLLNTDTITLALTNSSTGAITIAGAIITLLKL